MVLPVHETAAPVEPGCDVPAAAAGSAALSLLPRGLRSLVSEVRVGGERERRSNREVLLGSGSF